jgi:hypothetical protein
MKKIFTFAVALVAAMTMNAEVEVVYDWAGKVGTTTIESSTGKVSESTGKYNKSTEVPALKFESSYKSTKDDVTTYNYITITPKEGGFKKGDVLKFAAFYNTDKEKEVKVWVLDAEDNELYLSGLVVNGRTEGSAPTEGSFTFAADIASVRVARNGGSSLFISTLKVERGGATAIDNTEAEVKTVKTFENGQLVIIKNGVKYNATGAIVK